MNHQAVVAELRCIAARMMETKRHADADKIKPLLRSYFDDAALALKAVWPLVRSPLPWVASGRVALPALRHLLDGRQLPTDGDAFKVVHTVEYREAIDGEIDSEWDRYTLLEADITEPQREKFYYDQARSWADLLLRFADMIEGEAKPIEAEVVAPVEAEPSTPIETSQPATTDKGGFVPEQIRSNAAMSPVKRINGIMQRMRIQSVGGTQDEKKLARTYLSKARINWPAEYAAAEKQFAEAAQSASI